MTALSARERDRHARTVRTLFAAVLEVEELADGYAFHLPATRALLRAAADFVALERRCCPFFAFAVELAPGADAFRLTLRGAGDVRPFIRAELPAAFSASAVESPPLASGEPPADR